MAARFAVCGTAVLPVLDVRQLENFLKPTSLSVDEVVTMDEVEKMGIEALRRFASRAGVERAYRRPKAELLAELRSL